LTNKLVAISLLTLDHMRVPLAEKAKLRRETSIVIRTVMAKSVAISALWRSAHGIAVDSKAASPDDWITPNNHTPVTKVCPY